jgi:hypothetical protein
MPRGAYWPRLLQDGSHNRRHALTSRPDGTTSNTDVTPTVSPQTSRGRSTRSALANGERLATASRSDLPRQPGLSLQSADKAIPLHINRLSSPTLSLCCTPHTHNTSALGTCNRCITRQKTWTSELGKQSKHWRKM